MNVRNLVACAIAATATVFQPVFAVAQCEVGSGPKTAAVVELYTSAGCWRVGWRR
jgi:hypothetical protein